ncbi:DNA starvation/stationary phase protection protein [Chitinophaga caeni]|uniref:DNA starvation/stationary phase protection protein n=1 Tax=Chitinophaga caeni TaxID=2029983 RepID=A0A291QR80_9BACT|nr:DNA starvation/stationary phase protection protein [Chitinophaga caeni]ATL46403.1 DNA starvation/stationary phase protection protein [Chitinophaga caeni]
MKVNIGVPEKNLQAVADKLQVLLADESILYTKTRNYHWNVEGQNFSEMHLFYEGQYGDLAEMIDEVAERIRQLGHYSVGRLADFLKLTHLLEPEYTNDQKTQLKNLLDDHETIIRFIRECIREFDETHNDAGSSDFVTGLMEKHEKMAWMLRSYLK